MRPSSPEQTQVEPHTLILAALGWILEDDARAQRFLDLTGLDPDGLRARLGDPAMLASVVEFLGNHEPDLIKASEALAVAPEEILRAGKEVSQ
jgi:hypothetical protein